ncbi:MAG: hypothetical protein AMXMBFR13_06920 [Phycisphaerae bacterium]
MAVRDEFNRTVCACSKCRSFCKIIPGMLAPGDPERIAEYLGISSIEVNGRLLASPGAIVVHRYTGSVGRIHTIVPERTAEGVCVFLDEQERCTIHPVAPFGCAYLDDHLPAREGNRRSSAALQEIIRSPWYEARWMRLWHANRRAPAPEKLRARIAKSPKR